MGKKVEERRKGEEEKNTKKWVVVGMNRGSDTDHIQSQQTAPLFTEGRLKGSNVKSLQHF